MIVNVAGPFTEELAERVVHEIRAAAGRPVDLRIDSIGGKLGAAVLIMLEIEESRSFITTTAVGQANSAAGLVMMAGDRRRATKDALMLVHHATPFNTATANEIVGGIAEYTGASRLTVWDWLAAEKTFSATEAKAAGLVDEIAGVNPLPTVFLREPVKRRPAAWLRQWREDYERLDLR